MSLKQRVLYGAIVVALVMVLIVGLVSAATSQVYVPDLLLPDPVPILG